MDWQRGRISGGVLLDQLITLDAFSDVRPLTPYYDAIQGLIRGRDRGISDRRRVSQFRPTNSVFRAQFAKMIVGVLGMNVNENMARPSTSPTWGLTTLAICIPTSMCGWLTAITSSRAIRTGASGRTYRSAAVTWSP